MSEFIWLSIGIVAASGLIVLFAVLVIAIWLNKSKSKNKYYENKN